MNRKPIAIHQFWLTLWVRALGFASYIHIQLADYQQPGWSISYLIGLFVCLGLCFCPLSIKPYHTNFSKYYICLPLMFFLSKCYTLYFLRDVLTQSFLLAFFHLFTVILFYKPILLTFILTEIRLITVSTYGLAIVHKLNDTFLWSPNSCALHGIEISVSLIHFQFILPYIQQLPIIICSVAVLLIELLLAYDCWQRNVRVWSVACLFHLPLTLTIAPAFAMVMYSGYLQSFSSGMYHVITQGLNVLKRSRFQKIFLKSWHWYALVLIILAFDTGALFIKTLLMCLLLWVSWKSHHYKIKDDLSLSTPKDLQDYIVHNQTHSQHHIPSISHSMALSNRSIIEQTRSHINLSHLNRFKIGLRTLSLCYIIHGFSPYLGFEVQHSAAMLSNLRIDPACHNSILFPVLSQSPYFYINKVSFGDISRPQRTETLYQGVWNWTALHQMKKNWCVPQQRPLSMQLQWHNQTWHIKDLCDQNALHDIPVPWYYFSGWQRFQKNLERRCDCSCIH